MNYSQIESQVTLVREAIKKGRLKAALENLETFILKINDNELDKAILILMARFNLEERVILLGTNNGIETQNQIINAITQLLNETKEIAIEKATIKAGTELEKLNEKGNIVVERLDELTKLMAESRLLEIEVTFLNFGRVFTKDQNLKMQDHINRFKKILNQ